MIKEYKNYKQFWRIYDKFCDSKFVKFKFTNVYFTRQEWELQGCE